MNYPHCKDYLNICRAAFYSTSRGQKIRLYWNSPELDAAGWKAEFMTALDKRITAKAGEPKGRKFDALYQTELERDCRAIRDRVTRRIRLYQVMTPELRKRFGHLVTNHNDR